nr:hypothetical protein [Bacteroidota bacterium]
MKSKQICHSTWKNYRLINFVRKYLGKCYSQLTRIFNVVFLCSSVESPPKIIYCHEKHERIPNIFLITMAQSFSRQRSLPSDLSDGLNNLYWPFFLV